jgi:hypothetical protein
MRREGEVVVGLPLKSTAPSATCASTGRLIDATPLTGEECASSTTSTATWRPAA